MGWFLINIALPIGVPLVYLLGAKLVDLPEPYASRAKLIRAVQDGQLGWVATVFSAACVYELLEQLQAREEAPLWIGLAFALSCGLLAISGFLAVLGTLYPLKESKLKTNSSAPLDPALPAIHCHGARDGSFGGVVQPCSRAKLMQWLIEQTHT